VLESPSVECFKHPVSVTGTALVTNPRSAPVFVVEAETVFPSTDRAGAMLAGQELFRHTKSG